MYLFELFSGEDGGMIDHLRSQVMDYLTPLAASEIEFIPIQDIADILRNARTGLVIDRGLIMRLIEPNECKLVKEIQGDKIYLQLPMDDMSAKREEDEEKDKMKVQKSAETAAKKAVQSK